MDEKLLKARPEGDVVVVNSSHHEAHFSAFFGLALNPGDQWVEGKAGRAAAEAGLVTLVFDPKAEAAKTEEAAKSKAASAPATEAKAPAATEAKAKKD